MNVTKKLVKYLVPNPLLKYASEKLLFEANPRGTRYFRDTHFNKMIFLIYESLKEREIDMCLPYCWYRHGTLIHEPSFYSQIGLPPGFFITSDKSTRRMTRVPNNNLPHETKSTIDEIVDRIVFTYQDRRNRWIHGGTDKLLDDDYSFAPYEFQRIFKRRFEKYLTTEFRTPVRRQIPRHSAFSLQDVDYINSYLDELMCAFPSDMDFLNDTYQDWEDTARISLEWDQDSFLKIVEDFWAIFSKHLRILHNENIPNDTITFWKNRLTSEEFPEYKLHLSNERKRLLKIWDANAPPNSTTIDLVKKINRISFDNAMRGS